MKRKLDIFDFALGVFVACIMLIGLMFSGLFWPAFARMMGGPQGALIGAGSSASDYFTYDNGELELKSAGNFVRWETHVSSGSINIATNQVQFIAGTPNAWNAIYAHKDTFASRYVYSQIQITNETGLDTGVSINLKDQGSQTWDGYVLCVYLSGIGRAL